MKIHIRFLRCQDYDQHLRAHRRKRFFAFFGSCLFLVLMGIALGKLSFDDGNAYFIAAIVAWGVWGFHHLLTRHK